MSGKIAFELPTDPQLRKQAGAELVEAIPGTWGWLNGQLDAPLDLVSNGSAADIAGFRFSDSRKFELTTLLPKGRFFDRYNEEERYLIVMREREALLSILADYKLPAFVQFYHAGFNAGTLCELPLESIKRIAANHIRAGYSGDLSFFSDCYRNREFDNPESCRIHLAPYEQMFPDSKPNIEPYRGNGDWLSIQDHIRRQHLPRETFPPHIMLEWDSAYSGKRENLQGLIDACVELKLEPLEAGKIKPGYSHAQPLD